MTESKFEIRRMETHLGEAKILGGIGSILTLLGLIPFAGTVFVILGWVLVAIAIKYVSDAVQDRSIFNYAIISVFALIIGTTFFGFLVAPAFLGFIGLSSATNPVWSSGFPGLIGLILLVLGFLWILAIVSSIFLYMSFKTVASKLNVGLFSTAALIYVIAEGLTIILVGFILAPIAQILFAIAFFSIPERIPVSAPPSSQMTPMSSRTMGVEAKTTIEKRFCTRCGTRLDTGASFCAFCGASTNASMETVVSN